MLIKECMAPREAYTAGTMARPSLFGGIDALKWKRRAITWLGFTTGCMNSFGVSQSSLVTGDRNPV